MENLELFKGLNLIEFSDRFKTDQECLKYLFDQKWKNGFICSKCDSKNYWKGHCGTPNNLVCKNCRHSESPTANTIFHRLKFSLRKAFFIIFECSATTKGISSSMVSRRYSINEKTAWKFMYKIRCAMQSSGNYPLEGKCEVDEYYLGGKEESKTGRGAQKKKKAVVIIEKSGKHGISRAYARRISNTSSKEIRPLLIKHVGKNAELKTDLWSAYVKLSSEFNIVQEKSIPKKNFGAMNRFIMTMKSWFRGIHHQVSDKYYQNYLDEYCYRFNRNNHKDVIFQNLLNRMILTKPIFYTKNYTFSNNV